MIKFKKIKWKNFLSTGDHWTEIDFLEKNTNLIIGHNGSGKSTLLDALTFVLFNKPFRKINKTQLINTVNEKDCLVELEFDVNAREYVVRRGMKPTVFDIEVNGSPLHRQADDRSNQKILEENILKVNYKSFTQIFLFYSWKLCLFFNSSSSFRVLARPRLGRFLWRSISFATELQAPLLQTSPPSKTRRRPRRT